MEMDDYLESFWDSLFFEISTYPILVQILIALFCFIVFVYIIQIVILIIGLAFNQYKDKTKRDNQIFYGLFRFKQIKC